MLYEYDEHGELVKYGYSLSGKGKLIDDSNDRITKSRTSYEKQDGAVWKVEDREYFVKEGSTESLKQVRREKMGAGAGYHTEAISPEGVTTAQTRSGSLDSKTFVHTTTCTANPGRSAVQVVHNGRVVSASTLTVAAPSVYVYDAFGRVKQVKEPRTATGTVTIYLADGRISAATDADNYTTSYQYYGPTEFGGGALPSEVKAVIKPGGATERFGYDAKGQITHKWGSAAYPVWLEFDDAVGDLIKMHTYRSDAPSNGWSGADLPAGFQQQGDVTQWRYISSSGLMDRKTDALGRFVEYSYFPSGLLHTRTWARAGAIVTTYQYSLAGELTSVEYSDATPGLTTQYDRAGRPIQRTDAAGVATMTYHGAGGRLDGISYSAAGTVLARPNPSPPPGLTASGAAPSLPSRNNILTGAALQYGYSGTGRKDSFSSTWGQETLSHVSYAYEGGTGRLQAVSMAGETSTYAYVNNSDLIHTTTTGVVVGTRAYSDAGRLENIGWSSSGSTIVSSGYGFDSSGRRETVPREDGSKFSYSYNTRGEVILGRRLKADDTPMVGWHSGYQYDAIGNRKGYSTASNSYIWESDAGNRLTERQNPTTQYVLSRAVNNAVVHMKQNGAQVLNEGRDGAEFYAVATRSDGWESLEISGTNGPVGTKRTGNLAMPPAEENLTYDDDGNMTSDWRWTYEWDGENRLKAITPTAVAIGAGVPKQRIEYGYDGMGRRIQKLILEWQEAQGKSWRIAEDRRFIYHGWNLMSEILINNGGAAEIRFAYGWGSDVSGSEQGAGGVGGVLLARSFSSTGGAAITLAPCFDGNGNVIGYLESQTAAIKARYEYDPFGRMIVSEEAELFVQGAAESRLMQQVVPSLRFSTKYLDLESDLLYYGYRLFSPDLGRWTNRDPNGEAGGINLLAFVDNNPISNLDFLGLFKKMGEWTGGSRGPYSGFVECDRPDEKLETLASWITGVSSDAALISKTTTGGAVVVDIAPLLKVLEKRIREKIKWEVDRVGTTQGGAFNADFPPNDVHRFNDGTGPSAALDAFFRGNSQSVSPRCDCLGAVRMMQNRGLQLAIGSRLYFSVFKNLEDAPLLSIAMGANEAKPGDRGAFLNDPSYLRHHPKGGSRAQNVINVGPDRWWGHPSVQAHSARGWEENLIRDFNHGIDARDQINAVPGWSGGVTFFDIPKVAERILEYHVKNYRK